MDFIKQGTSHQYWLAKSFLLLADIYIISNYTFEAKATLQSLIDNYAVANDGIIDEANKKLLVIIKDEKQKEFVDEEEIIELNFEDNVDGKYDDLFMDEKIKQDSSLIEQTDSIIELEF